MFGDVTKREVICALHNIAYHAKRSCKHSERFDCTRGVDSKSYKEFDLASGKSEPIGSSFLKKDPVIENTLERGMTRAGAIICQLIEDANVPLATADKMTAAMKMTFSHSKIASSKALPSSFRLRVT